jgi:hypothetical protein
MIVVDSLYILGVSDELTIPNIYRERIIHFDK